MGAGAATVRRLALALPETVEAPHHDMTSFRVAGKVFATMPPEGGRVHVFLDEEEIEAYCAEFPDAVEELWWGTKRRGCKVLLSRAPTALLRELLTESWRRRAPRTLLSGLDGETATPPSGAARTGGSRRGGSTRPPSGCRCARRPGTR